MWMALITSLGWDKPHFQHSPAITQHLHTPIHTSRSTHCRPFREGPAQTTNIETHGAHETLLGYMPRSSVETHLASPTVEAQSRFGE